MNHGVDPTRGAIAEGVATEDPSVQNSTKAGRKKYHYFSLLPLSLPADASHGPNSMKSLKAKKSNDGVHRGEPCLHLPRAQSKVEKGPGCIGGGGGQGRGRGWRQRGQMENKQHRGIA